MKKRKVQKPIQLVWTFHQLSPHEQNEFDEMGLFVNKQDSEYQKIILKNQPKLCMPTNMRICIVSVQ